MKVGGWDAILHGGREGKSEAEEGGPPFLAALAHNLNGARNQLGRLTPASSGGGAATCSTRWAALTPSLPPKENLSLQFMIKGNERSYRTADNGEKESEGGKRIALHFSLKMDK